MNILLISFLFYGSVLYLPHRKSDFCVYKTTIETMGLINGGKYKYQLRNDLLLPLSYCCTENKEFICHSWIINEWRFIEAETVTFYILSRSKEGYRDRDLFGLKLFMNMRAFTHFIFMREAPPHPLYPNPLAKLKKGLLLPTLQCDWLFSFHIVQNKRQKMKMSKVCRPWSQFSEGNRTVILS